MIVRFGLELDRLLPTIPQTSLGQVTAGPGTLLSILEIQLGLPNPLVPPATRLVQYRACLQKSDSPKRFYHKSFQVDDLSVARTLLDWRDEWYSAGWDGTFSKKAGHRLNDMAEVENLARKEVSPSLGQRLQAVSEALENRKTQIEKIDLVDALSDIPSLWQQILSHFNVVELKIDKRQPQAEMNSDLLKLQKTLLGLNQKNGSKPEKVKLKADGSVVVLQARSKEVSARILAEHIKANRQKHNLALIAGHEGVLFDEALECVDEARCGFEKFSNWRPALQVLPLALNLLWHPLDPYLLLQFLNHPLGPLPKRYRRKLAAAVIDSPGIGGRSWQKALNDILERERKEKKANNDKINNIQERINFWVAGPRFDLETGSPISVVINRCEEIARWLGKMRWVEKDSPAQHLFNQASGQAQDLVQALELLAAMGMKSVTQSQLNRLLDEVAGSGAPLVDKFAECNHVPAGDNPAVFTGDFEEIVWFDFSMPELPKPYPWTRAEKSALSSHGVQLQALDDKLTFHARTWLRPVMSAQKRIIFVLHYSNEEHHPLWDQITACASGWLELDAENLVQTGGKILELGAESQPLTFNPLPPNKRWWKLKNGKLLGKRESESYTSLDTFVKSPYQWVLKYKARLEEGSLAELSTGNLLKGNLVHRLIEDFFSENRDWKKLTDKNIRNWLMNKFPTLLEQEGAVLLGPGQTTDREIFIETATRAVITLLADLKAAGARTVAVESKESGTFVGGKLSGRIDMLITDAKNRDLILDVKWAGSQYRTADLRANMHLQLATYAHLIRQPTTSSDWPPQAFFIIEDARILAQDKRGFPSAIVLPSHDGETTGELWRRFETTWKLRRAQLDKGMIEVTVENAEPDNDSVIPDDGLQLDDHYDRFNDFAVLTGWGEDA